MAINQNDEPKRDFNPNEHLMQIKSGQSSKDYLPVQWRLVWFRSAFPHGTIETEMIHLDLDRETEEEVFVWNSEKRRSEKVVKRAKGFVVFKATVSDGVGGVATGTKTEKAASFPDYIEKAETGSIGRALAALGYGTQFTGDEWNEAHRIVDSPADVTNGNGASTSTTNNTQRHTAKDDSTSNHHSVQGNASKSNQEPNLSDLENGNKSARQTPVVASSDSGASTSGQIAAPSAVERVKDGFVEVYGVAEDDIEVRWPKYKRHILGQAVADPDMTLAQVAMLNGDIVAQRKKIAGKAS